MAHGALDYANGRFSQRRQPLPGMDADQAEGRFWQACALYPVDLWNGAIETVSEDVRKCPKARPFSFLLGLTIGAIAGVFHELPTAAAAGTATAFADSGL